MGSIERVASAYLKLGVERYRSLHIDHRPTDALLDVRAVALHQEGDRRQPGDFEKGIAINTKLMDRVAKGLQKDGWKVYPGRSSGYVVMGKGEVLVESPMTRVDVPKGTSSADLAIAVAPHAGQMIIKFD